MNRTIPNPGLLASTLVTLSLLSGCEPTASPQPQAVFFAAGDIARCNNLQPGEGAIATAQLLDRLTQDDPEAQILALGDLAYVTGTEQEFQHCYDPTWGRHKARTLPVPGNHEYYVNADFSKEHGIAPYNQYFKDRFATLDYSGDPEEGYYATTTEHWKIVAINTQVIVDNRGTLEPYHHKRLAQIDDVEQRQALLEKLDVAMAHVEQTYPLVRQRQQHWLEQQVFDGSKPCKLVFMHHPRYSSGGHGHRPEETEPLAPLYQLLYDNDVSLVLTGHDHQYERFAPLDAQGQVDPVNGQRPFVVGTGGAEQREFGEIQPHSEVRGNVDWGVLKVELFENSYAWQFIPTEGEPLARQEEACVPRGG